MSTKQKIKFICYYLVSRQTYKCTRALPFHLPRLLSSHHTTLPLSCFKKRISLGKLTCLSLRNIQSSCTISKAPKPSVTHKPNKHENIIPELEVNDALDSCCVSSSYLLIMRIHRRIPDEWLYLFLRSSEFLHPTYSRQQFAVLVVHVA